MPTWSQGHKTKAPAGRACVWEQFSSWNNWVCPAALHHIYFPNRCSAWIKTHWVEGWPINRDEASATPSPSPTHQSEGGGGGRSPAAFTLITALPLTAVCLSLMMPYLWEHPKCRRATYSNCMCLLGWMYTTRVMITRWILKNRTIQSDVNIYIKTHTHIYKTYIHIYETYVLHMNIYAYILQKHLYKYIDILLYPYLNI